MGVTSLGRHLRPACNLDYCRDLFLLNHQKNMIFDLNTVCFSLTSGDARGLGILLSVCACALGLCENVLI